MLKHRLFLSLLFIGLGTSIFGQSPFNSSSINTKSPATSFSFFQDVKWDTPYTTQIDLLPSSSLHLGPFLAAKTEQPNSTTLLQSTTPLPAAFTYEDLAVFCKLEYKMEKAFKFPVKIRLGEVHYTEKREGKE